MSSACQFGAPEDGDCIMLPLNTLRRDGETQSRLMLSPEVIEHYCELMLEGADFPPVRACFDGGAYWLTDGYHRVAAAERAGLETIRVEVFAGTLSDARWDSYRANAVHGVRRTPEDLKLVVTRALSHEKGALLSNRELARHLHVSERTVRRFREIPSATPAADARVATRNGKQYTINTANIGKNCPNAQSAGNREPGLPLERRLAADLLRMDREASPHVRRILNILKNWTQRRANPMTVLQALEHLIAELNTGQS